MKGFIIFQSYFGDGETISIYHPGKLLVLEKISFFPLYPNAVVL